VERQREHRRAHAADVPVLGPRSAAGAAPRHAAPRPPPCTRERAAVRGALGRRVVRGVEAADALGGLPRQWAPAHASPDGLTEEQPSAAVILEDIAPREYLQMAVVPGPDRQIQIRVRTVPHSSKHVGRNVTHPPLPGVIPSVRRRQHALLFGVLALCTSAKWVLFYCPDTRVALITAPTFTRQHASNPGPPPRVFSAGWDGKCAHTQRLRESSAGLAPPRPASRPQLP